MTATPRRRRGQGSGRRLPPSALVLAAGTSTRFPGTKLLAELGGTSLLERVIRAIPREEVAETVVVVGHDAGRVADLLGTMTGVRLVANPRYRRGMASSIRTGVLALGPRCGGVLLLLADQPFVTGSLLRRTLESFRRGGSKGIVAAERAGVVGPPVVFSRAFFPELTSLKGDRGARAVLERHASSLTLVRARGRDALADVDTREDLEAARRLLEAREAG